MKFFRRFFQEVFSASIPTYDKKFYPTVAKREYGPALGYFAFFVFLISLIIAALAMFGLRMVVNELAAKFETDVPDFELAITNGVVTTNLSQPYVIPEMLVIDTTGAVTSLENRAERILLTTDKLYIKENGVQTDVFDLDGITSLKITKDSLQSLLDTSKVGVFILAFLLMLFGIWLGLGIWYFFYTLLISFIAWLFVKQRLRFAQVHQVSLYAITGPVIFISIWHLFATYTPYLFSIVFIGYLILALKSTKSGKSTTGHKRKR